MWSEILRPILRWPLRNPLRLLATLAAALLLIFGIGSINRAATDTRPVASSTSLAASGTQTQDDSTGLADQEGAATTSSELADGEEEATPEPPTIAAQRATAFLIAWAQPTVPADQWRADLAPFVDPLLAQGLALTDPINVPASRVDGAATLERAATRSALYDFATDAGTVRVTMTSDGITWWVSEVTPQDEGMPAAEGSGDGTTAATPAG